ncbi:MAG: NAD-dependent epimerase/dehydratase family protein [Halorhodospira sp.]
MSQPPTVFLTGPRSFTAAHLVPRLEAAGMAVVPFEGDVTDGEALARAVHQAAPDYVVHLAALSFPPTASGAEVYAVNTVATERLLAACAELASPPRRVLLPSTGHVYGRPEPGQRPVPFHEGLCPAPRGHYANSKCAMEHLAAGYADRVPIVLPRPFNYTGPGQAEHFLIPKLVAAYQRREPELHLGNTEVARDFSDVRWVVEVYTRLLQADGAVGPVNVCSGRARPLQAALDHLADRTGHRPVIHQDPALIRPDDPPEIRGDPARLHRLLPGVAAPPPLEATIDAMIEGCPPGGGASPASRGS